MKNVIPVIVFLGLIFISNNLLADVCIGTTVTYPWEQGVGYMKIYTSAVNFDGSSPPQSHSGLDGRDLTVTWNGVGQGKVYIYEIIYDGSEFNIFMYVNVNYCLSLSSSPVFLCNGNSGSFTLADSNGSTSYSWTAPAGWSINGGSNTLTTSSTSVTITAANPSTQGHNIVSVTSNNSGYRSFDVWVGAPSGANYRIYPSGLENIDPVTLVVNGTYSFLANSPPGATTLTWNLPTGFTWGTGSHTGSPVNIKTSASAGNFILTCTASNSCGSSAMHNLHITTSSSGGGRDRMMATDDVAPTPDPTDTPYPIPASDNINISLSQAAVIQLINSQGTVVRELIAEGQTIISIEDLNAGVYVVKLRNKSGLKHFRVSIQK